MLALWQVRMSEYSQLKGQVTAAARKQTGSLAVRDLTGLVKHGDAVNTENLITLFTVVSKSDKPEWQKSYEVLSDFVVSACALSAPLLMQHLLCLQGLVLVENLWASTPQHEQGYNMTARGAECLHGLLCPAKVPRSSKLIYEDNDYSLFSVTLFKRVADSFKAAARSKGFQV